MKWAALSRKCLQKDWQESFDSIRLASQSVPWFRMAGMSRNLPTINPLGKTGALQTARPSRKGRAGRRLLERRLRLPTVLTLCRPYIMTVEAADGLPLLVEQTMREAYSHLVLQDKLAAEARAARQRQSRDLACTGPAHPDSHCQRRRRIRAARCRLQKLCPPININCLRNLLVREAADGRPVRVPHQQMQRAHDYLIKQDREELAQRMHARGTRQARAVSRATKENEIALTALRWQDRFSDHRRVALSSAWGEPEVSCCCDQDAPCSPCHPGSSHGSSADAQGAAVKQCTGESVEGTSLPPQEGPVDEPRVVGLYYYNIDGRGNFQTVTYLGGDSPIPPPDAVHSDDTTEQMLHLGIPSERVLEGSRFTEQVMLMLLTSIDQGCCQPYQCFSKPYCNCVDDCACSITVEIPCMAFERPLCAVAADDHLSNNGHSPGQLCGKDTPSCWNGPANSGADTRDCCPDQCAGPCGGCCFAAQWIFDGSEFCAAIKDRISLLTGLGHARFRVMCGTRELDLQATIAESHIIANGGKVVCLVCGPLGGAKSKPASDPHRSNPTLSMAASNSTTQPAASAGGCASSAVCAFHKTVQNLGNDCFMNATLQALTSLYAGAKVEDREGGHRLFRSQLSARPRAVLEGSLALLSIPDFNRLVSLLRLGLEYLGQRTLRASHALEGEEARSIGFLKQQLARCITGHTAGQQNDPHEVFQVCLQLLPELGRAFEFECHSEFQCHGGCSSRYTAAKTHERDMVLTVNVAADGVGDNSLEACIKRDLFPLKQHHDLECEGCGGARRCKTEQRYMTSVPKFLLIVIKVQDNLRTEDQLLDNFKQIDLSKCLHPDLSHLSAKFSLVSGVMHIGDLASGSHSIHSGHWITFVQGATDESGFVVSDNKSWQASESDMVMLQTFGRCLLFKLSPDDCSPDLGDSTHKEEEQLKSEGQPSALHQRSVGAAAASAASYSADKTQGIPLQVHNQHIPSQATVDTMLLLASNSLQFEVSCMDLLDPGSWRLDEAGIDPNDQLRLAGQSMLVFSIAQSVQAQRFFAPPPSQQQIEAAGCQCLSDLLQAVRRAVMSGTVSVTQDDVGWDGEGRAGCLWFSCDLMDAVVAAITKLDPQLLEKVASKTALMVDSWRLHACGKTTASTTCVPTDHDSAAGDTRSDSSVWAANLGQTSLTRRHIGLIQFTINSQHMAKAESWHLEGAGPNPEAQAQRAAEIVWTHAIAAALGASSLYAAMPRVLPNGTNFLRAIMQATAGCFDSGMIAANTCDVVRDAGTGCLGFSYELLCSVSRSVGDQLPALLRLLNDFIADFVLKERLRMAALNPKEEQPVSPAPVRQPVRNTAGAGAARQSGSARAGSNSALNTSSVKQLEDNSCAKPDHSSNSNQQPWGEVAVCPGFGDIIQHMRNHLWMFAQQPVSILHATAGRFISPGQWLLYPISWLMDQIIGISIGARALFVPLPTVREMGLRWGQSFFDPVLLVSAVHRLLASGQVCITTADILRQQVFDSTELYFLSFSDCLLQQIMSALCMVEPNLADAVGLLVQHVSEQQRLAEQERLNTYFEYLRSNAAHEMAVCCSQQEAAAHSMRFPKSNTAVGSRAQDESLSNVKSQQNKSKQHRGSRTVGTKLQGLSESIQTCRAVGCNAGPCENLSERSLIQSGTAEGPRPRNQSVGIKLQGLSEAPAPIVDEQADPLSPMPRVQDCSDRVRGYAAHDQQGFAQDRAHLTRTSHLRTCL